MAKKPKVSPYRLGSPTGENPTKEMSWCFSRHIYISCEPEAIKEGRYWKQLNRYKLTIRQGDRYSETGYDYTKDNIMDAIWDAYRNVYKMNYGKKKE